MIKAKLNYKKIYDLGNSKDIDNKWVSDLEESEARKGFIELINHEIDEIYKCFNENYNYFIFESWIKEKLI